MTQTSEEDILHYLTTKHTWIQLEFVVLKNEEEALMLTILGMGCTLTKKRFWPLSTVRKAATCDRNPSDTALPTFWRQMEQK